jgi:hypothetical protein
MIREPMTATGASQLVVETIFKWSLLIPGQTKWTEIRSYKINRQFI